MKRILLTIFLLSISYLAYSQDECYKQINVPTTYYTETQTRHIPAYKRLVSPAIWTEKTEKILVKEPSVEKYMRCDANGIFSTCEKNIEAEYKTIKYLIKIKSAVYEETPERIEQYQVKRVKKAGYIKTVPCDYYPK